jgi:membrane protein implicated in regulation of membrane protease activity
VKILPVVFLAAFIAGLVLAVFAMLHGVEHTRRNRSGTPSPYFNLPALAAFAVGFGAVGYPVTSRTNLPSWGILIIAVASGALSVSGMIALLASWALRGLSSSSPVDEHEIQGQLAVVTRDISWATPGEISYELSGQPTRVSAKALTEKVLPAGTEVVIDRIENGVAFVEEWAVVEQRI